jgi:hypothetical protein
MRYEHGESQGSAAFKFLKDQIVRLRGSNTRRNSVVKQTHSRASGKDFDCTAQPVVVVFVTPGHGADT